MDQVRRTSPSRWLDLATMPIRFGPDQRAVRRELEAHLEDRVRDLRRIYPELTEKEARERAAADMGDPVEIGRALARIHRPWLGYLWRASQAVLAASLLLTLLALARTAPPRLLEKWRDWEEQNELGAAIQEMLYGDREPQWEGERLAVYAWEPALEAEQGHGTLTVSRAALWREDGVEILFLDARLDCDFPHQPPEYFWYECSARDDRGNAYLEDWMGRGGQRGFGWSQMNLMLYDFDPAAERVYLDYLPGTELSLTIDLEEGELS